MPKDTFYNLPEEKRKIIEDAAIDEFAEYNLEKASVNRIVEKSKISKGSFYQYFEDKTDLFIHLMDLMKQEKLKYISPVLSRPDKYDFFTFIKELYIIGLEFASQSPRLMKIGNNFLKNRDMPAYKEVLGDSMDQGAQIYESLLKMAIAKGEIREDIDLVFTAHMMLSINVSISEYWFKNIGDDYSKFKDLKDEMLKTVDAFIEVIKNGIAKK